MKKLGTIFILLAGFVAQSAMADLLGLANGRSANNDNMADMSVEGGISIGDFRTIGARFNYKLNQDIMLFGDLAQIDVDGIDDGFSFGGGVFYQLRGVTLLENTDLAVKASFHSAPLDFVDYTELAIEGLISGDQLSTTDFGWYANVGLHILSGDIDIPTGFGTISTSADSTEFGLGGGITGQASVGEWFVGLDLIDSIHVVGGFRYNL